MATQLIRALCAPVGGSLHMYRLGEAVQDRLHFLRAWLRDPMSMAAVAPSGRALAALITRGIGPDAGPVLELGSGTGVFAAALIARGVAERDLVLVERDAVLARRLANRFPRATVRAVDATQLSGGMAGHIGATVCGLGLLAMSMAEVEAIVAAAFRCMGPDGALHLFTYGRRCSVPADVLARLDLTAQRVGTAWRNLPPASVYRLSRREGAVA